MLELKIISKPTTTYGKDTFQTEDSRKAPAPGSRKCACSTIISDFPFDLNRCFSFLSDIPISLNLIASQWIDDPKAFRAELEKQIIQTTPGLKALKMLAVYRMVKVRVGAQFCLALVVTRMMFLE